MKTRITAALLALLAFPSAQAWWQPSPGLSWQIQFNGVINPNLPVQVYDIDLFDSPQSLIDTLHAQGKKVICYISAGTFENWRPDASRFPAEVKGRKVGGWAGEKWLDIRRLDILQPIMRDRMALAAQKGCDAIDPDNVDGYTNRTGFTLKAADQLAYNRMLAAEAHALGMAVGLKNDLNQVPDLVGQFDFAINESCMVWNECALVSPFIAAGKPVFHIEYQSDIDSICAVGRSYGFSSIKKNTNLDEWAERCL